MQESSGKRIIIAVAIHAEFHILLTRPNQSDSTRRRCIRTTPVIISVAGESFTMGKPMAQPRSNIPLVQTTNGEVLPASPISRVVPSDMLVPAQEDPRHGTCS